MWDDSEEARRGDDWKQWKRGWQYELDAPIDPIWQQDRTKLFRENGNGWWWFQRNEGDMPNQRAKTRKRNRIKLNKRLSREGRTANQVKKRREKDKRNDLNRN